MAAHAVPGYTELCHTAQFSLAGEGDLTFPYCRFTCRSFSTSALWLESVRRSSRPMGSSLCSLLLYCYLLLSGNYWFLMLFLPLPVWAPLYRNKRLIPSQIQVIHPLHKKIKNHYILLQSCVICVFIAAEVQYSRTKVSYLGGRSQSVGNLVVHQYFVRRLGTA